MPRFAANVSTLYTEHPFEERFEAAAHDGFEAVEFQFPYAHDPHAIRARLQASGQRCVLFNAPPGDLQAGERGLASLPGRRDDFRRSIDRALLWAEVLDTARVHVLAGLLQADTRDARAVCDAQALQLDVYQENLAWAAPLFARAGRLLLIEPINPHDIPGYWLNRQAQAHAVRRAVGSSALKVQMDLYHVQRVEGDLSARLDAWLGPDGEDGVGHLQLAGVPGRHEPDDTGELNWPRLFERIDALGWAGWIGAEYHPRAGTRAGLGWYAATRSP